jgi:hypothetical protein
VEELGVFPSWNFARFSSIQRSALAWALMASICSGDRLPFRMSALASLRLASSASAARSSALRFLPPRPERLPAPECPFLHPAILGHSY